MRANLFSLTHVNNAKWLFETSRSSHEELAMSNELSSSHKSECTTPQLQKEKEKEKGRHTHTHTSNRVKISTCEATCCSS